MRSTVRKASRGPTTRPPRTTTSRVEGVAGTPGAIGYFGYTYYEENRTSLKAREVDRGDGCVAPSADTAQSGESYTPLARPLFIYVNTMKSYADKPQVASYVDFYIQNLTADHRGLRSTSSSTTSSRRTPRMRYAVTQGLILSEPGRDHP